MGVQLMMRISVEDMSGHSFEKSNLRWTLCFVLQNVLPFSVDVYVELLINPLCFDLSSSCLIVRVFMPSSFLLFVSLTFSIPPFPHSSLHSLFFPPLILSFPTSFLVFHCAFLLFFVFFHHNILWISLSQPVSDISSRLDGEKDREHCVRVPSLIPYKELFYIFFYLSYSSAEAASMFAPGAFCVEIFLFCAGV